ncbi:MAG: class I SAM-dependent methyltransferase [Candidatus Gracilibacteria bacterium]|jgi:SAM-dependent methyltransferase
MEFLDRFVREFGAKRELRRTDLNYADSWRDTAINLYSSGVYEHVSRCVKISDRPHVDLGCGFGFLLDELRRQNPSSKLLGVDSNREMIRRAKSSLSSLDLDVASYETRRVSSRGERLDFDFHLNLAKIVDARRNFENGRIVLVQDDIRNMRVLREILGDEKLGSATLTFPGVSVRDLLMEQNVSREQVSEQLEVFKRKTLEAVFAGIAEVTEKGASFVFADFMALPEPALLLHPVGVSFIVRQIIDQLQSRIGESVQYWSISDFDFAVFDGEIADGEMRLSDDSGNQLDSEIVKGCYILSLERC